MNVLNSKYEPVIGLEIHAQMNTASKAFCGCSTDFHSSPNTNICPVCLGYPGALPALNEMLVDSILKMGIATSCRVREESIFARKNYFYPDLTKGYQITQFETPICHGGFLKINLKNNETKKIGITRIHMEEDAGKSIHDFHDDSSLIDFNRCGVPLIEIVSEPDMNSVDEATRFLQKIKQTLVYLEINDGNMEEGSLRCDANISVRIKGDKKLGTRTEIKNLNSFKNVSDAVSAEIKRQISLIESGEKVSYNTMTYNAKDKKTTATRSKEEAHDYRYFPEPDLVKVKVTKEKIENIKSILPELPEQKVMRYVTEFKLPSADAEEISHDKDFAGYFERVVSELKLKNENNYRTAGNILRTDVRKVLNDRKISISEFTVSAKVLAGLAESVTSGSISASASREVFNEILFGNTDDEQIKILENSLKKYSQVSDTGKIESLVKKILEENPEEVKRYKIGEKKLAGFFVGKIMQESKGKANPKIVNELLIKNLED
ncbi:MAG: Aspartyl/glutamyl-tRNA(Asn/Gln) amidotransferase subunit B [Ignavibacteria bacterium]|nr:Aspartyl/glutamyl-tRNA(Asn/Gln) amidotransferase subunit B [Ignavibacteria bacterium]